MRIEDYGFVGNLETAALIGTNGAVDWFCVPRFDSPACFAALLGDESNGAWTIAPKGEVRRTTRRYRDDSLVLETLVETDGGAIQLIEFMPVHEPYPSLVRIVEGVRGTVPVAMTMRVRFGYGDLAPWTRWIDEACTLTACGDALALRANRKFGIVDHDAEGSFDVGPGERIVFVLTWYPSHRHPPPEIDPEAALEATLTHWRTWSAGIGYRGDYRPAVMRSLLALKALIFESDGASVAAVTTSLPELIGGAKNWDYRFSWVRDSAFTISALMEGGMYEEIRAWRDWVLRALAGRPERMQIMYGIRGERRIDEYTLDHLAGYEGSRPVRIGNAAYQQFQLGIYGETMSAMYLAHQHGVELDDSAWAMIQILLDHVEQVWEQPDSGIWESRGEPRHYTHSKVQAWNAFNRAVKLAREHGFPGPVERWEAVAARIHAQVCDRGFDRALGSFIQFYGSSHLDASLLLIPIVEFLPATDPRVTGTVAALERALLADGFLYRTTNDPETSQAAPGPTEGAFLPANFWLVENYMLQGRSDDARQLFERLIATANDVGLLSEEYDPKRKRLVGNFPQTLTHAALINAAKRIADLTPKAAQSRGPL